MTKKHTTSTKGAIAEEIAQDKVNEQKAQLMEPVWEIYWAFCDVYWNEETPVEDFPKLLAEFVSLLNKVADGSYAGLEEEQKGLILEALERHPDRQAIHDTAKEYMAGVHSYKKDKGAQEITRDQIQITEKDANTGEFTAVASTALEDRHGEVVDVKGWDLKNFQNNPVLLWAHDHSIPAIGRATKIWISEGRLMFKGVFQTATELGRAAKQLVDDGILNSFSVGFLPYDLDGNRYTKQELLEISLVNVPANPDARILAYKSLQKVGVSKSVIEDFVGVPTELLDKILQMEKDLTTVNQTVESLVKAQAPAAPVVRSSAPLRKRQMLVKTILRATDQLLAGEKSGTVPKQRVDLTKVIKRAGERLSASHKEQFHGKNR